MTPGEVNTILKRGSMRKKMLLFMENVALYNTTGYNAIYCSKRKDIKKNRILTPQESTEIWDSVKAKKDLELLDLLTTTNKSFVIMKPTIERYFYDVWAASQHLVRELQNSVKEVLLTRNINTLLKMLPDGRLEEAKEDIDFKDVNIEAFVNYRNGSPSFALDRERDERVIKELTRFINANKEDLKFLIKATEVLFDRYLPLKYYYDYLKDLEGLIRKSESNILKTIEARNSIYKRFGADLPKKETALAIYDDIVAVVLDEDIATYREKA